jgi:hypothetical protein
MQALLDNLDVVSVPPPGDFVVFVDDVVTYGDHIAAADYLLRPKGISGAVVIGATHSTTRDAYEEVRIVLEYERNLLNDWVVYLPQPT